MPGSADAILALNPGSSSIRVAVALLVVLGWAPVARADDAPKPPAGTRSLADTPFRLVLPSAHLLGDWAGARTWLEDRGVELDPRRGARRHGVAKEGVAKGDVHHQLPEGPLHGRLDHRISLTGLATGQSSSIVWTSSVIIVPEAIRCAPLWRRSPKRYLPARSRRSTAVKST